MSPMTLPARAGPAARARRIRTSGSRMPAPKPWTMREAMRLPASQANPAASEAAAKSARPRSHMRLPPNRSTAQVVNGMAMVTASRKPVEAHPIAASEASNSAASRSRPTATMVLLSRPRTPPSRITPTSRSSGASRRSFPVEDTGAPIETRLTSLN